MTVKTYAAPGLLDFRMAVEAGGAIIRLCFTGGSMGSNGVISAKYTTDNPAIQRLIENSRQFKERRIYLFSEKEVKEKEMPVHLKKNSPSASPMQDKGIIELD